MKQIPILLIFIFLFTLLCSPIKAEQMTIPSQEIDDPNEVLNFKDSSDSKIQIVHFLNVVKEATLPNSKITSVISYLVDLKLDGTKEIVSLIRLEDAPGIIAIFDSAGKLLASAEGGYKDKLIFGVEKKGFPVFFAFAKDCYSSAAVCEWEIDFWDGSKIKKALETFSFHGKGQKEIEPYFVYLEAEDTVEEISDGGSVIWSKGESKFIAAKRSHKSESLQALCPQSDKKLNFVQLGKMYFRERNYACAVKEYTLAIKENVNDYEAWQYLGYVDFRQGDYTGAISSLKKSLEIKPDYDMGHYNLALAYWANRRVDKSIEQLKILYEENPKYKTVVPSDVQFKSIIKSPAYKRMFAGL